MKLLAKKIEEIEIPDDMRERIVKNCYNRISYESKINSDNRIKNRENTKPKMNSNIKFEREVEKRRMCQKKNVFFRRTQIATATLVLCVCITGGTVLATSGKLQGYFKDIKNWNGAVTGTAYEQATDEITVNIINSTEELDVEITFLEPGKAPYLYFEEFGIASYRIEDVSGNIIVDESSTDMVKMNGEQLELSIPLEGIPNGNYKLIIDSFVGDSKADQPLELSGIWSCEFEY